MLKKLLPKVKFSLSKMKSFIVGIIFGGTCVSVGVWIFGYNNIYSGIGIGALFVVGFLCLVYAYRLHKQENK
mgnify:CR=1 FL=1